jgi:hypothetical protein
MNNMIRITLQGNEDQMNMLLNLMSLTDNDLPEMVSITEYTAQEQEFIDEHVKKAKKLINKYGNKGSKTPTQFIFDNVEIIEK